MNLLSFITVFFACWAMINLVESKMFGKGSLFLFSSSSSLSSSTTNSQSDSTTQNNIKLTNSTVSAGVVCEDGICRIPDNKDSTISSSSSINTTETTTPISDHMDETTLLKVKEVVKLGWSETDAIRAIKIYKGNVEEAVNFLTTEDEEAIKFEAMVDELVNKHYWNKEISEYALRKANMNITQALAMLNEEEQMQVEHFDKSVQDMVTNGWDEFIARQALIAQWKVDARKAAGINESVPADVLTSLRPTLRRSNETESKSSSSKSSSSKVVGKSPTKPKPAKKEDCVFEVNTNDFQKIVLESPVPVLLDLYADWCGPCKQLTPMLENAAIKSGGMFRLVKVNVDKNRDIVNTVNANGFPTVFAINQGKFTDKFVGLLPGEEIEKFLVRAVTGYGDRVQADDISESELHSITTKMNYLAGLASLTFKKKEKLNSLVEDALKMNDAWNEKNSISESIQTATLYIQKVANDIRNKKYRTINTLSKIYQAKIASSPSAIKLLQVAGFRQVEPTNSTNSTTSFVLLELQHNNVAVLNLILQRVNEVEKQRKFSNKKTSSTSSSSPVSSPIFTPTAMPTMSSSGPTVPTSTMPLTQTDRDRDTITVTLKPVKVGYLPMKKKYSSTTSIQMVVTELLKSSQPNEIAQNLDWNTYSLEIRYPLPRKVIPLNNSDFNRMTIRDLAGDVEEIVIGLVTSTSSKKSSVGKIGPSKKSSGIKDKTLSKNRKRGVNTLFSTGILDKKETKHNEYFGGDSTVVLGGDEDKDDDSIICKNGNTSSDDNDEREEEFETVISFSKPSTLLNDDDDDDDDDDSKDD